MVLFVCFGHCIIHVSRYIYSTVFFNPEGFAEELPVMYPEGTLTNVQASGSFIHTCDR